MSPPQSQDESSAEVEARKGTMKRLNVLLGLLAISLCRTGTGIEANAQSSGSGSGSGSGRIVVITVDDAAGPQRAGDSVRETRVMRVIAPEQPAAPSTPAIEVVSSGSDDEGTSPVDPRELSTKPSWFDWSKAGRTQLHEQRGEAFVFSSPMVAKGRAKADLEPRIQSLVKQWLTPDVPRTWNAPRELVDGMERDLFVEPRERETSKDLFSEMVPFLYVAGARIELTQDHRSRIVEAYQHQLVRQRLITLGGGSAFLLACLLGLSTYIRADERTKGYYTNRLRLMTVASVGVAGAVIYRFLV